MRRLLRIVFPNWLVLPLTIAAVLAAGDLALTYAPVVASAASSRALSGDRQAFGPIRFWVDERFSPAEISAIRAAFATWQSDPLSDVAFELVGATPTPDRALDDGRNVVVRSARPLAEPPSNAVLAETQRVVLEGTSLYRDTDVVIDFSGRVPWATDDAARAQDLQSLVTHEIGHVLGLDHVTDPEQVMYPVCPPGRIDRRELRWGDLAAVADIYPQPLEEATRPASSPRALR